MLDWKSLPRPIIALSPMADMTDSAFCRVVRSVDAPVHMTAGPGVAARSPFRPQVPTPDHEDEKGGSEPPPAVSPLIVFREMVSSEAVVRGSERTLGMTDIYPTERPLVQQLFGSDPETMAEAARIIEAEHHPEGFDINMGCPVYKIVHNFNGAALMKEPERAASIITAIKKVISVPLSVKIRLGWSDPRQCLEFIKVIEAAGADLVTIHGRTKTQGYSGKADWAMIGEAKRQVSIPVLCNGDIHKPEQIVEALKISGCDGVLIARGALGNPWIFSQMHEVLAGTTPTPVTLQERLRVIRLHATYHVEQYGERGIVSFRKHLTWYFKGLPGAKLLREQSHSITTLTDLERVLHDIEHYEHRHSLTEQS